MSDPHVPIDRTDDREPAAIRPPGRRDNMPAPPGAVQRGTAASGPTARDEMEPAHPDRAARDVMEPAEPRTARDVMQPGAPGAARDVMEPDPTPQAPETD